MYSQLLFIGVDCPQSNVIGHIAYVGEAMALIPPTEMVDFGLCIHIGVESIVPPSKSIIYWLMSHV